MRNKNMLKEVAIPGLTIDEAGQLHEFKAITESTVLLTPQLVKELGISPTLVLACIYEHLLTQTETDRDGNRWIQLTTEAICQETGLTQSTVSVALRYLKAEKFIVAVKEGPVAYHGIWYSVNLAPRKIQKTK